VLTKLSCTPVMGTIMSIRLSNSRFVVRRTCQLFRPFICRTEFLWWAGTFNLFVSQKVGRFVWWDDHLIISLRVAQYSSIGGPSAKY